MNPGSSVISSTMQMFLSSLYSGAIFERILWHNSYVVTSYFQSQSFLALLSFKDRGHEAAMALLVGHGSYSSLRSGMSFWTSLANYSGVKLTPAKL
jgi:hypothetical protein